MFISCIMRFVALLIYSQLKSLCLLVGWAFLSLHVTDHFIVSAVYTIINISVLPFTWLLFEGMYSTGVIISSVQMIYRLWYLCILLNFPVHVSLLKFTLLIFRTISNSVFLVSTSRYSLQHPTGDEKSIIWAFTLMNAINKSVALKI